MEAEMIREIQEKARYTRAKYSELGLRSVFEILNHISLLIRRPFATQDISGFSCFFEGRFITVLNSSFTLGHEIFTAAHELYHQEFDRDILRKELILPQNIYNENEEKAQRFAVEFLMPEDGIRRVFDKNVAVEPDEVTPRHIIRMQHVFQVSYRAMTRRLVELGLCSSEQESLLKLWGEMEKAEELKKLTIAEGKDVALLQPSKEYSVPGEYIKMILANYEKGKITYGRLSDLLRHIEKSPQDYSIETPEMEE